MAAKSDLLGWEHNPPGSCFLSPESTQCRRGVSDKKLLQQLGIQEASNPSVGGVAMAELLNCLSDL